MSIGFYLNFSAISLSTESQKKSSAKFKLRPKKPQPTITKKTSMIKKLGHNLVVDIDTGQEEQQSDLYDGKKLVSLIAIKSDMEFIRHGGPH